MRWILLFLVMIPLPIQALTIPLTNQNSYPIEGSLMWYVVGTSSPIDITKYCSGSEKQVKLLPNVEYQITCNPKTTNIQGASKPLTIYGEILSPDGKVTQTKKYSVPAMCDLESKLCNGWSEFCFLNDEKYKSFSPEQVIGELDKNKDSKLIKIPENYKEIARKGCLPNSLKGYFDKLKAQSVDPCTAITEQGKCTGNCEWKQLDSGILWTGLGAKWGCVGKTTSGDGSAPGSTRKFKIVFVPIDGPYTSMEQEVEDIKQEWDSAIPCQMDSEWVMLDTPCPPDGLNTPEDFRNAAEKCAKDSEYRDYDVVVAVADTQKIEMERGTKVYGIGASGEFNGKMIAYEYMLMDTPVAFVHELGHIFGLCDEAYGYDLKESCIAQTGSDLCGCNNPSAETVMSCKPCDAMGCHCCPNKPEGKSIMCGADICHNEKCWPGDTFNPSSIAYLKKIFEEKGFCKASGATSTSQPPTPSGGEAQNKQTSSSNGNSVECDSCKSCSDAINNCKGGCTVRLKQNILATYDSLQPNKIGDDGYKSCITVMNPVGTFVFDCGGNSITGEEKPIGVGIFYGKGNLFDKNKIINCRVEKFLEGIWIDADTLDVENSIIVDNSRDWDFAVSGISLEQGGSISFRNNVVCRNGQIKDSKISCGSGSADVTFNHPTTSDIFKEPEMQNVICDCFVYKQDSPNPCVKKCSSWDEKSLPDGTLFSEVSKKAYGDSSQKPAGETTSQQPEVIECDSCKSCSDAINNCKASCLVKLTKDIIVDYSELKRENFRSVLGSYNACITIVSERRSYIVDHFVFDCGGHKISGDGKFGTGISYEEAPGIGTNEIKNCYISNFLIGAYLSWGQIRLENNLFVDNSRVPIQGLAGIGGIFAEYTPILENNVLCRNGPINERTKTACGSTQDVTPLYNSPDGVDISIDAKNVPVAFKNDICGCYRKDEGGRGICEKSCSEWDGKTLPDGTLFSEVASKESSESPSDKVNPASSLPSKLDLSDYIYFDFGSAYMRQWGQEGIECGEIATITALEGDYNYKNNLKGDSRVLLSEHYLKDCSKNLYSFSQDGTVYYCCYPAGSAKSCKVPSSASNCKDASLCNYRFYADYLNVLGKDIASIKNALVGYGPLTIMWPPQGGTGHQNVIYGWDDNYELTSNEFGEIGDKKGVWLIRETTAYGTKVIVPYELTTYTDIRYFSNIRKATASDKESPSQTPPAQTSSSSIQIVDTSGNAKDSYQLKTGDKMFFRANNENSLAYGTNLKWAITQGGDFCLLSSLTSAQASVEGSENGKCRLKVERTEGGKTLTDEVEIVVGEGSAAGESPAGETKEETIDESKRNCRDSPAQYGCSSGFVCFISGTDYTPQQLGNHIEANKEFIKSYLHWELYYSEDKKEIYPKEQGEIDKGCIKDDSKELGDKGVDGYFSIDVKKSGL